MSSRRIFALVVFAASLATERDAHAGFSLYVTQIKNIDVVPAASLSVNLMAGGTIKSWTGTSPGGAFGDLFATAVAAPFPAGFVAPFGGGKTLAAGASMTLSSIRATGSGIDNTKSNLVAANGAALQTKISQAKITPAGDPQFTLTNTGSDSMTLLTLKCLINNSEDPLTFPGMFVPDGTDESSTLSPGFTPNMVLGAGQSIDFSFAVGISSSNFSIELTSLQDGTVFDDLVATDSPSVVPEPSSLLGLSVGLLSVFAVKYRRRRGVAA
jgi:hypothetical protein